MASVWKKTMQYLGLVEDEDLEDLDEGMEEPGAASEAPPVRRLPRGDMRGGDRPETIVRTMPSSRIPAMAAIHRAEPRRFNDARDIGERFKQGVPVKIGRAHV